MLTTREISAAGFGAKNRDWNRKPLLLDWRREWAAHANRALELAGHDMRIDHRSYRELGLAIEPQDKIGKARNRADGRELVAERMAEHEAIARRNGEAIIADPSIALAAITYQRATFTRTDVGRWLNGHTADAEQFQLALLKVMASPELVKLAKGEHGSLRYTTREMLAVEQRMLDAAQAMAEQKGHAVSEQHREQGERVATLSADQRKAFDHIMQPRNLAAVQGRAGAGKSYMLGAAREAWEAEGYRVIGGALAGKAAEGLQISSDIQSQSLHAWEYAWDHGREQLTKRDVLVIDEAGMLGSRQLGRIIERAHAAGAKVVLVGDDRQLQPIEAGAAFRAIKDRVGQVEMVDIQRQKVAWQKQATHDFFEGRVDQALTAYAVHGNIHPHQSQDQARRAMVAAWDAHRHAAPADVQIMLAFERKDVRELNELARRSVREAGELGRDVHIETTNGPRDFAGGDRVYFGKNDRPARSHERQPGDHRGYPRTRDADCARRRPTPGLRRETVQPPRSRLRRHRAQGPGRHRGPRPCPCQQVFQPRGRLCGDEPAPGGARAGRSALVPRCFQGRERHAPRR